MESFTDWERWDMWNDILNMVRIWGGKAQTGKRHNPYRKPVRK